MTEEDLIAALEAARHEASTAEGALTVEELMQTMGISKNLVRKKLRGLHDAGALQVVRRRGSTISGQTKWVPAYRLLRTPDAAQQ